LGRPCIGELAEDKNPTVGAAASSNLQRDRKLHKVQPHFLFKVHHQEQVVVRRAPKLAVLEKLNKSRRVGPRLPHKANELESMNMSRRRGVWAEVWNENQVAIFYFTKVTVKQPINSNRLSVYPSTLHPHQESLAFVVFQAERKVKNCANFSAPGAFGDSGDDSARQRPPERLQVDKIRRPFLILVHLG